MKRAWQRIAPFLPGVGLALVVGLIAAVMLGSRRPGHWWGDDWALYIRQAEGLLHFEPGEVARSNEFTVRNSMGPPFSPPLYPWGFPLVLALAIPFVGTGVDDLAIVQVLSACAFACAWFVLARPRLGAFAAWVGVPAVAVTPVLLSWGELIQSEWAFLATAAIGLAALDWLVRHDRLLDVSAAWWPLAALGVWAAFVFEIRREGLAMVAAIGVAQVAALTRASFDRQALPHRAGRVLVPHACMGAVTLLIKIALPSVIVPQYSGNSITNTWERFDRNIDHVLEIAGLKRPGRPDPTVFGSVRWGWIVAGAWLGLAVIGMLLAVTWRRRRDAFLVAYALVAFVIGASAQASLNRYFATVAPVLTLLAATAFATIVRLPWRLPRARNHPRWATAVTALLVAAAFAGLVVAHGRDARVRLRNTDRILDAGTIEWGAQHPDAQAMYAAVRRLTEPDDVVASPKARAMGLMAERPSIQVDDYRPLPDRFTVDLIVTEPMFGDADRVAQQIATNPAWHEVWRNSRFVLYEPALP